MKRYVNKDATEDPASIVKPPPIFLPNLTQNQPDSGSRSNQQMSSTVNQPQNQRQPQQQAAASNLSDPSNNMPAMNSAANRFSLGIALFVYTSI